MMKPLRETFHSRISIKLMLAFFLFIMLPMFLVIGYIGARVTNQMLDTIRFANERSFTQANDLISLHFEKIISTVSSVLGGLFPTPAGFSGLSNPQSGQHFGERFCCERRFGADSRQ